MTDLAVGASWASSSSPLVRALERATGRAVRGVGLSGAALRTWAAGTAAPEAGQVVYVFEMGGNTQHARVEDVRAVHRKLISRGAHVAWVLPPAWPATHSARAATVATRREAMRVAILAAGVPVIRHGWRATEADLRDYAHLTTDGYARFVQAIVNSRGGGASKLTGWLVGGAAVLVAIGMALGWR